MLNVESRKAWLLKRVLWLHGFPNILSVWVWKEMYNSQWSRLLKENVLLFKTFYGTFELGFHCFLITRGLFLTGDNLVGVFVMSQLFCSGSVVTWLHNGWNDLSQNPLPWKGLYPFFVYLQLFCCSPSEAEPTVSSAKPSVRCISQTKRRLYRQGIKSCTSVR